MKPFAFSAPATVAEAIALLSKEKAGAGLLSGGTDLIIQIRAGRREIGHMIDVKKIPELNVLSYSAKQGLRLGAAVPCFLLAGNDAAVRHYPSLTEGAELIGSTQIQSRATVGGNVCNGSPAADTICPLIVLNAVCVMQGPKGTREVPAEAFMVGPGKTALGENELLVEFRIPPPEPRQSSAYLRFIPRNEMDIAVADAAAAITLDKDGRTCTAARIAIGAVGPTPFLVEAAGAALVGSQLEDSALEAAGKAASAAAQPITDLRGTVEYRIHMAGVLTRRAVQMAAERAREAN